MHAAAEGWKRISCYSQTYVLLQLDANGRMALIADAQLEPGTYDQIRLEISKVIVTDAQGDHEAKLPSEELRIQGRLIVEENSTSTADFDFQTDESLHVTGNGRYIMEPVIQLQTRSDAAVDIRSKTDVVVTGGTTVTDITVGTDAEGNVGVNIRVPSNVDIGIVGNIITVGGTQRGNASSRSNMSANVTSRTGVGVRTGADVDARTRTDVGVRTY